MSKKMIRLATMTLSDHSHQWAMTQCDLLTPSNWPLSGWPSHWPAWTMNQQKWLLLDQIFVIFSSLSSPLWQYISRPMFFYSVSCSFYYNFRFSTCYFVIVTFPPASPEKKYKVRRLQPYKSSFRYYKCVSSWMCVCKGINEQTYVHYICEC